VAVARNRRRALIVLAGLPGAGKSTLARVLCRDGRYVRIDRDALRAQLFPGRRVTDAQKRAANAAVWFAASRKLRQGRSVVIDGMTFARSALREEARRLARRHGVRYVEVFVHCPRALARSRVARAEGHPATDRNAALVDAVAARFDPVSRHALRVAARWPVQQQLRRLQLRIGRERSLSSRDAPDPRA
jgi:predicted kinase